MIYMKKLPLRTTLNLFSMIVLDQPENSSVHGWKSPKDVEQNPYSIDFSTAYKDALNIFQKEAMLFVVFTLIVFIINAVLIFIPVIGAIGSIAVQPALTAGYFLVADKIRREESIRFEDFFDGFKGPQFGQLILLSLISGILIGVGIVFCIIPGIWLAISYIIAMPILIFLRLEFWDAMEASRKIIAKNFWAFLGIIILISIATILLTAISCGLALVVIVPITQLMVYSIFVRLFSVAS